jgi:small-conductance mechanosensitive channel
MINGNYRASSAHVPLPKPRQHIGLAPGDHVRGAASREHEGETGIVVERGLLRTKVRWTSGEITSVPNAELRRIGASS